MQGNILKSFNFNTTFNLYISIILIFQTKSKPLFLKTTIVNVNKFFLTQFLNYIEEKNSIIKLF